MCTGELLVRRVRLRPILTGGEERGVFWYCRTRRYLEDKDVWSPAARV